MKFRKGDKVERYKNGSYAGMDEGDTGVITCNKVTEVILDKNGCRSYGHSEENLRLVKRGGNEMTKRVWEVIIVDKEEAKVILKEIVIDGDEKSACSKVSITHADKLKGLEFDNLCYIAKELGSYETKEEPEED